MAKLPGVPKATPKERAQLKTDIIQTLYEWWSESDTSPVYPHAMLFGGKYADNTLFELVKAALNKA